MEIVLLWCFVLAWMAKRGAEDLVHAVKGTPNPRYEAKKAKAKAAGQRPAQQPRYGGKEWFADLMSDAMVAHTEKRRTKAAAKAQPVDDMIGILREPQPAETERVYDPNNSRTCPDCKGEVVLDGRPCPRCLAVQQRRNAEWEAQGGLSQTFGPQPVLPPTRTFGTPEEREEKIRKLQDVALAKSAESGTRNHRDARGRCTVCGAPNSFDTPCSSHNPDAEPRNPYVDYADQRFTCSGCGEVRYPAGRKEIPGRGTFCLYCQHNGTADEPTAQIIQFPNIKQYEKEIDMSNPEAAGLSTAIAFAEAAASAHQSFATAGAEGYIGALQRGDMDGEPVDTAREAMEASGIAADKWNAHKATLEAQLSVKEAYQSQPGAANKEYLLNG